MADLNNKQSQSSSQIQKQHLGLSQKQIQGLSFLSMGTNDLRDEIYKAASENPALEIISDPQLKSPNDERSYKQGSRLDSDKLQQAIENREDKTETLQDHLMHQLNSMKLSQDEIELSQKLIYNLDKNGCYGSSISPETLLDKTRPMQNLKMLNKCIERIQKMDPVGTCCRTLEESLYVQGKISGEAPDLALFILNGNLEMINPPEPGKILKKLNDYKEEWHNRKFATTMALDNIKLSEELISKSLKFILTLNPRPAQGYAQDTLSDFDQPDVVITVEKVPGFINTDRYEDGIVSGNEKFHFQVKYASGALPNVRISPEFSMDKENLARAKNFLDNLAFRESSIMLQSCAIVAAQKGFFLYGMEHLAPLTRRQIAQSIGINESTVSRLSGKKSSKYIQTEFGNFPMSYFFSSGIESNQGEKMSSEVIKLKIMEILEKNEGSLSDSKLTEMLNNLGINIARRTVAKYRKQLGIENSYNR